MENENEDEDYMEEYWVVTFGFEPNIENNTIEWYIDGLQNVTDNVPIAKQNLFNLIKGKNADWDKVNNTITGMKLRVRFNNQKLDGVYVFKCSPGLFKTEKEFEDWFNTNPNENMKLIKSKSVKA